jgi:glycosyltransferase involved in cell wall biosynthesis
VVHAFPPKLQGGADTYTYGLAAEMREQGHSVWVLCHENLHDPETGPDEVRAVDEPFEGIPVRRLHWNWRKMQDPYGALYVSNPVIERLMFNHIQEIKPDVVHVTACEYVSNAVVTASTKAGLPVVLTLTGKWHICPKATLLRWDQTLCEGRQPGLTCLECMFGQTRIFKTLRRLPPYLRQRIMQQAEKYPHLSRSIGSLNFMQAIERRNALFEQALAQVDYIISPSRCHQMIFDRTGTIPVEQIVYSPHGHNTAIAATGQHKKPSEAIRFGYTGQIVSHKGVDTLIEAFNRLQFHRPALLNVYGDPNLESEFGRKIQQMASGNESIVFHGRFFNSKIGEVLSNIDMLIVPSKCIENAPVTIAEAFAAQTPVIGSDTCGVAEHIKHGTSGLLFQRGNPDDLAYQMQRILDQPDLLPRLREGTPTVRPIQNEAFELLEVYQQLISQKRTYRETDANLSSFELLPAS